MASQLQGAGLDFQGTSRITNLPDAVGAQEPATLAQLQSAVEGINWKDSVRVASVANVTISSPGATIDGITMATSDRVLLKNQSSQPENGIYIWNGAATPMTRALDANTTAELEAATVTAEEGTNAGTTWRQTQVNFTLGSGNVIFTAFGTSSPAASESTAGIAEIATQAETDTGTDDLRFVTPLKLATYSGRKLKYAADIGDGSTTSITVTHSLGTKDVLVRVFETGGTFREVGCEIRHTSTSQVTLVFDVAPTTNSLRVLVVG